jgi:hypothetical protein
MSANNTSGSGRVKVRVLRPCSSLPPSQPRRDRCRLPRESSFSSRHRLDRGLRTRAATDRRPCPAITAQPTTPRLGRLCRLRQRYIVSAYAFLRLPPPRWAFSSPLALASSRLVPPEIRPPRDYIPPSLRPTWRVAAASPRTISRHAWAQIDQAAGHTVIWGGPLGVRRHAQGARDGELSIPRRRWRVCAIDRRLKNEPTTRVACRFSTAS